MRNKFRKPKTRAQCYKGLRPCPWISCKQHLIWLKRKVVSLPDEEIATLIVNMEETCLLDVTDREGETLNNIGNIIGSGKSSRQLAKYVIGRATELIKESNQLKALKEYHDWKLD